MLSKGKHVMQIYLYFGKSWTILAQLLFTRKFIIFKIMIYQNSPTIREEILKSYIEQIFGRYDTQKQGTLGPNDITNFFNDLFKSLNINMVLTPQHSYQAVKIVYPNFTTSITRDELFMVFKAMLGLSSSPSPPTLNTQYQSYGPSMMSNTNYMSPQMYYNANMQQGQNFVIAQNMMRQNQAQNMQGNFQQMNMSNYMQQNQGNQQFNGGRK